MRPLVGAHEARIIATVGTANANTLGVAAPPVEGDANALGVGASPVEGDADTLEGNASPLAAGAQFSEGDTGSARDGSPRASPFAQLSAVSSSSE